jgi:hypothetical protein
MNSLPGVNPVFEWWVIVAFLLLLLVFFGYREYNRKQKFLPARMAALTIMMIAVTGIFLRPYFISSATPPPAILLTKGYDKRQVDSIINVAPPARIFSTETGVPYQDVTTIHVNEVGTIVNLQTILGGGLPLDALELLPSSGFHFLPSPKPAGITEIHVPKNIRPHELNTIYGIANVEDGSSIQLVGPGGVEDSTHIHGSSGEFALRFRPRHVGLFMYSVILKNKSTTQTSNIPIEVKEEKKLKFLFLQKFPTAEARALKNYLVERNHAVALRYQVSKTNFNYEYSNLSPQPLNRLTPELLGSFDLLFLDSYLFEEIGGNEKDAIKQSIRNGLGVIFFVDGFGGRNSTLNSLLPVKGKKTPTDTVHLQLETPKSYALPAVPIFIPPSSDLQPVLQSKNRVLSGYIYSGFGKVGFQLLRETYRLRLEGNIDDYASTWHELIERVARMKPAKFKLVLKTGLPITVNESVQADVLSDGTQPTLLADNTFVPIEEDVLLDDLWHARIWATTRGWHAFRVKNDSSRLNYFVSDTAEWKALRQVRQLQANRFRSVDTAVLPAGLTITKNIHPLLWYMLFLASAGFLWLAPKL